MAIYRNIGKYDIRRQIGRGAMGVVYEAFDPVIQRRVAIKVLRLELFEPAQLADVRARFRREAQLAGQMSHPHIVTVYDYGEHEDTPYIVMEFMTGSELSKLLEQGTRLPVSEVVRIMTELLEALAYAHDRKIVHRDIKPGNVFILADGSVKVVDFGIARLESSNLTDAGAILGTPAYMSPEQFLALPVGESSDIFSAGVMLYELLTGDKPFTGSVTTIMQKVLHHDPIQPSILNPLLSKSWDAIVRRAMAKPPEARFQSARQFSETVRLAGDPRSELASTEATLPGTASPLRHNPPIQAERPSARPSVPRTEGRATEPGHSTGFSISGKTVALAAAGIVVAAESGYLLFFREQEQARPGQEERSLPTQKMMLADSQKAAEAKGPEPAPAAQVAMASKAAAAASRSERERLADEGTARAALAKAASVPAREQQTQVASVAPETAAAASSMPQASDNEALYQQALAMENGGDAKGAIRLYRRAARAGSGKAAKRLGEIFDHGVAGVARDYAESLQWYETARQLGEHVETAGKR